MSDEERHPELVGYVPGSGSSLSHPLFVRVMRIAVVLGVAALIVPGVIATVQLQARTAAAACRIVVRHLDPEATGSVARFQPMGPVGPAWYCSSRQLDGSEQLVRGLGLIPGLDGPPVHG
jgi:hypothetical protein